MRDLVSIRKIEEAVSKIQEIVHNIEYDEEFLKKGYVFMGDINSSLSEPILKEELKILE